MQVAIVLSPGSPRSDLSSVRCCAGWPDAELRFVWHEPGPILPILGVRVSALRIRSTRRLARRPFGTGGMTTIEHARDEKVLDWSLARLTRPRR